jgi:outer membrane protein assembly factor BamD
MEILQKVILFFVVSMLVLLSSCKSEFEKIRSSGDAELLYKKAYEYYEQEEYQKAQTLYELIISSYRGKKEAEDIYFKYAYTYYHLERYILASYYFKNFASTFSTSSFREEADFMTAYSNYQLSPTFRLDQSYSQEAIDAFQLFVNTYPNSERVEQCNQLIDEMRAKQEKKAFEEGKLYFDLRQYQAAMHSFENLLKDFPESKNVEEVRFMIIKASYLLAQNSVVGKQEERYKETIEKSSEFLSKSNNADFQKEINTIYKNSSKKLNQINNVGYQNESAGSGS